MANYIVFVNPTCIARPQCLPWQVLLSLVAGVSLSHFLVSSQIFLFCFMEIIDYAVVAAFLVGVLLLGIRLSKKAGKSTDEFILAGRKLPWWLAGTSISATGLNASTMLQDSRKIRQDGISGMWFTWGNAISLMFGTVWFSRLWRRAGFTTQMEFYHARYRGCAPTLCRFYDVVVYGIVSASIWASTGLVGMKKVAHVLLGLPPTVAMLGVEVDSGTVVVLALVIVTLAYSAASGVYGVVWTDLLEFFIALFVSYLLFWEVFGEVGWNVGLREKLEGLGPQGDRILQLLPTFGPVLLYYLIINPILNQGGYNPHIQRYLGMKDEREVVRAAVFNAVLNFGLRPWPFYMCGLCGIFLISDTAILERFPAVLSPAGELLPDHEMVFPMLVTQYLPAGLVGLMAAGFLSAFMSSFDTNIHNSTAIVVNDLYRPYLRPNRKEEHYVKASRVYMVIVAALASVIGIMVDDILSLVMFAYAVMTSAGWVKILRFVWWRVNGAAELAAQASSLILTVVIISPLGEPLVRTFMDMTGQSGNDGFFVVRNLLLIGVSTLVSLAAIFCTKPEPMDHLVDFYRRVRPFGWWAPVREACGDDVPEPDSMTIMGVLTIGSLAFIFGIVFSALGFLLVFWTLAACSIASAVIGWVMMTWGLARLHPAREEIVD